MVGAIVGCCGWSWAQARYVETFPTIEIQTTFYQLPEIGVARRWKSLATPGFRFCMKAWQLITHTPASPTYRRLRAGISPEEKDLYGSFRDTEQVALAWERTREIADALEAEVIVFQCPKSFLPSRENLRNLTAFFDRIERGEHLLVWEPRGDEWTTELVGEVCATTNLIHCVDPFEREAVFGDRLYWRLHGRGGYRYRYTDEDLAELGEKLRASCHLPGPNYVMFNNMSSGPDALRFMQREGLLRSLDGIEGNG